MLTGTIPISISCIIPLSAVPISHISHILQYKQAAGYSSTSPPSPTAAPHTPAPTQAASQSATAAAAAAANLLSQPQYSTTLTQLQCPLHSCQWSTSTVRNFTAFIPQTPCPGSQADPTCITSPPQLSAAPPRLPHIAGSTLLPPPPPSSTPLTPSLQHQHTVHHNPPPTPPLLPPPPPSKIATTNTLFSNIFSKEQGNRCYGIAHPTLIGTFTHRRLTTCMHRPSWYHFTPSRRYAGCGSPPGTKSGSPVGPARGPNKAMALGLPGVDKVVAIASGKGGVGKSTTAVNLAVAMATSLNMKVGLLDADIHGPSIPTLMNLTSKPVVQERGARKLVMPLENYGVRCMSMGFFTKGDAPVVWRGPIVHTAINQFLMDTIWGDLDVLLVDMPPGTGDAQITLGQRLPLAGAVIVSSPQELAVLDARRGAQMFRKMNVPLVGFVSNMSYYQCPHCSTRDYIFGEGGVEKAARELDVEVLGEVPLDISIRLKSDEGTPVVVSQPDSLPAQAYIAIARRVKEKLANDPDFTP